MVRVITYHVQYSYLRKHQILFHKKNVIQTVNYQIINYHNKMNKVDKSYYSYMIICVCIYVLVCY